MGGHVGSCNTERAAGCTPAPADEASIEQKAESIIDSRSMDALASEMARLGPDARAALIAEIIQKTPAGWLQIADLDRLVSQGSVSNLERRAVLDGFARAYNEGKIDTFKAACFTGVVTASGQVAIQGRDAFDDANAVVQTLQRNDGYVAKDFAKKFAVDALKSYTLNPNALLSDQHIAAQAAMLLNAVDQTGGSRAVWDVLQQLTPEQRSQLRDVLTQNGVHFQCAWMQGQNMKDPMAIWIDAVGAHGSAEQAVELVKYAYEHRNNFIDSRQRPFDQRAEAFSGLFVTHGEAIMNALTVPAPRMVAGSTNPNQTVVGDNLAALSNLLRLTGLNPDNSEAAQVMDVVRKFLAANIRQANGTECSDVNRDGKTDDADITANDFAAARIAKVAAAVQDAVASGYYDVREAQAQRQAVLSFLVDTAVSVIPLGQIGSKAIAGKVAGMLGGMSDSSLKQTLENALNAVPNKLLSDSTGKLTEKAKQAIIDAVPEEYLYLEGIKDKANTLIEDAIQEMYLRPNQLEQNLLTYRKAIDGSRGR
jgi:hypothetical protein